MRIRRLTPAVALVSLVGAAISGVTVASAASTTSRIGVNPPADAVVTGPFIRPSASPVAAPDLSPVPQGWSSEKGGLDIGYLTGVTRKNGVVKVTIDRVSFFTGEKADALNGDEDSAYVVSNVNSRKRTFVLDPRASIEAELELRNDAAEGEVGRQKLTVAQFVRNAKQVAEGGDTLVWLRHTDGLTGDVTALAEQYVP